MRTNVSIEHQEKMLAHLDKQQETIASCKCAERVNEKLSEYNAMIESNLLSPVVRTLVPLCKVDPKKRGRLPLMEATYCPFCGKKYPQRGRRK